MLKQGTAWPVFRKHKEKFYNFINMAGEKENHPQLT